jgi:hypothetical protein
MIVDSDLLADFVGSRQDMKKPMTERAKARLMGKLERLYKEGHCPNKLLERSIIQGWQDVYPDRSTVRNSQTGNGFVDRHTDQSWRIGISTDTNVRSINRQ